MTESVYDGAQTAADILYGYRSYLRAEMVNLTNEEIDDMANRISQRLDYLEFLLEKAGVLKDKAKHHYTKHDWQHVR